jgi:E3 ubiquitin-protein ligase RAD18
MNTHIQQIVSALTCDICCELVDGPVALKCGHCFCSYCVRSWLADKNTQW